MGKVVFKSTSNASPEDYSMEVPSGDHVFREGDLGTEMFLIQEGEVEIYTGSGDEVKSLATLERGDFFGEMALLEDRPRSASARAATDSRLLRINGSTFNQMLQSNPEIAVRMMRKLSRRLRDTDRMLHEALGRTDSGPVSPEIPPLQPAEATTVAERATEVLTHEASGLVFPLAASSETTIGRRDPVTGIYPDVDLTPVDHQRSISRRHAKVLRRGERYFLSEEIGTMNGTFVNGNRLETGKPEEVKSGDEVRCGVVNLRFQAD
jgi:CRP/FNR family cyclic AMP-dependent transcriptional regulator